YAIDWAAGNVIQVSGREAILSRVREIAKDAGDSAPFSPADWCIDWETEHGWQYPVGWDWVHIPADARLRTAAMQWARSPYPAVRQRAALFLQAFRDPQAVDVLKRLLEDCFRVADKEWPYPVRVTAGRTLANWRIIMPNHVFEAPVINARPLQLARAALIGAGAILAAGFALSLKPVRGRVRISTVAAATIACAVVLLWIRSTKGIDFLQVRLGGARVEVSMWAGEWHCLFRPHAIAEAMVAYGSASRDAEFDREWAHPVWAVTASHARSGFRYETGSGGAWGACRLIVVPLWAFLVLTVRSLLPPIRRQVRAARRRKRCACETCGYDLRATADRCPECGRPVASRGSALGRNIRLAGKTARSA
ncbi:MAG TPA: hypothetical protein VGI81_29610, partial [Tepidisphaeraceae bacterium]